MCSRNQACEASFVRRECQLIKYGKGLISRGGSTFRKPARRAVIVAKVRGTVRTRSVSEESYAALKWVAAHAGEFGADGDRIAIAGNSVGGNIAMVWSVAGAIRPPTLRIIAASPGARPNISTGSTRGSTQPMIMVFIDGMIFRSAEKRLLAKASLRWVRVSITLIWMFVSILARLRRRRNGALLAAAAETFSGEAQ
jgi:dienelactone hydrolase